MPSFSDSRATTATGTAATSSGTNPSQRQRAQLHRHAQHVVLAPEAPGRTLVADPSVKYRISSARAGSGKPRSCASSSSPENTSLVATGVPSPEERTSLENTYPAWTLTRSKTGQPGLLVCGRDAVIVVFALDGAASPLAPVPPVPGASAWSRTARPRRTSAGWPAAVPPARSARHHRGPAAARNPPVRHPPRASVTAAATVCPPASDTSPSASHQPPSLRSPAGNQSVNSTLPAVAVLIIVYITVTV